MNVQEEGANRWFSSVGGSSSSKNRSNIRIVFGADADRGEDSSSLKQRQANELLVRATHPANINEGLGIISSDKQCLASFCAQSRVLAGVPDLQGFCFLHEKRNPQVGTKSLLSSRDLVRCRYGMGIVGFLASMARA